MGRFGDVGEPDEPIRADPPTEFERTALFLKAVTTLDQRCYNTAQIQIRHFSADVIALCHP